MPLQSIIDQVNEAAHDAAVSTLLEDVRRSAGGFRSTPLAGVLQRAGIWPQEAPGTVAGTTPATCAVRAVLGKLGRLQGVVEAEYGVRLGDL